MGYSILVVGLGVVGNNVLQKFTLYPRDADAFSRIDTYDCYKVVDTRADDIKYDMAFICVDTPMTEDNTCDTSEIVAALNENYADIYVIKSTVLPEKATYLSAKYPHKHIVFSPEYYGNTQHCNNYKFDFTILGGDKNDCIKVQQILQNLYDASHIFRITDACTACLVKYMENSYLATKVSFCNQFFNIAEQIGVDYEELRELFLLDPRVNPSHTFVYRDKPYWDSHCLNKDVPAIAEEYDAQLLKDMITFNESRKPKEDQKHE